MSENLATSALLAERVREIRLDLYGEGSRTNLADAVGVPAETWLNYEASVTMPALVLLRFLDVTGASPRWLLTGEGLRFWV